MLTNPLHEQSHGEIVRLAMGDRGMTRYTEETGIPRTTVYGWLQKDHVPEKSRARVAQTSEGRITAADFRPEFGPK